MSSTRITGSIIPEPQLYREYNRNSGYSRKITTDRMVGRLPTLGQSVAPAASHTSALQMPSSASAPRTVSAVPSAVPSANLFTAETDAAPLLASGMAPGVRQAIVHAMSRVPESDRTQFISMCLPYTKGTVDELVRRVEALASTWPPAHRVWLNVRR